MSEYLFGLQGLDGLIKELLLGLGVGQEHGVPGGGADREDLVTLQGQVKDLQRLPAGQPS